MPRQTDIAFIEALIEEFGLHPNQKLSTLIQCLEDEGVDDQDDEDEEGGGDDDEENENNDEDENETDRPRLNRKA